MTTMKANRLVAISIALLALAGTAAAQGVAWQDLTDAQRKLLAPHEQRWADLDPQRQEQIARGAERWLEMNRGDRAQAQNRFEIWRQCLALIITKAGLQLELGKQAPPTLGPPPSKVEVTVTTRDSGGWTVDYEPT